MVVAKEGSSAEQGDGTDVLGKDPAKRVTSIPSLARNIKLGMRMPSFKVLNQADARPWHFQELLKSDGRWRVVIFAGNIANSSQMQRIEAFGRSLLESRSFLKRFTPAGKQYDSVIQILTIHSSPRKDFTIFNFPFVLRSYGEPGRDGDPDRDGWNYWSIYVDDESYHEGHGKAYENYGIDPEKGCAIILRPDQYVSWVGEVDDISSMDRFFSGFMFEQGTERAGSNSKAIDGSVA